MTSRVVICESDTSPIMVEHLRSFEKMLQVNVEVDEDGVEVVDAGDVVDVVGSSASKPQLIKVDNKGYLKLTARAR